MPCVQRLEWVLALAMMALPGMRRASPIKLIDAHYVCTLCVVEWYNTWHGAFLHMTTACTQAMELRRHNSPLL